MKKLIIAITLGTILACFSAYKLYNPQPKESNVVVAKTRQNAPKSATAPIFHIGSAQTYGNLSIIVSGANFVNYAQILPPNTLVFGIDLTITNNGPTTYVSPDAFSSLSVVSDSAHQTKGSDPHYFDDGCFGGSSAIIYSGQTVNGCVDFLVPADEVLTNYSYDNLTWQLSL